MGFSARRPLSAIIFLALSWFLFGNTTAFAQACQVQGLRLGGQVGDTYIGPTCSSDETHRTCFYVSGENLPAPGGGYYQIEIEGVSYSVAFQTQLSPTEVVACATGIPDGVDYDVEVSVAEGCSLLVQDLYDPPVCSCTIDSLRLGGQTGDQYVGPTCNGDETHRTCIYVGGDNLPAPGDDYYQIAIEGVSYPVAFQTQLSPTEVVACATGIPDGIDYDVEVSLSDTCSLSVQDLYDTPVCSCTIGSLRLGGQQGDQFVGPTCNGDGTYRTCYYAAGINLKAPADPYYQLELNNAPTLVSFEQLLDPQSAVACATGLSPYEGAVDVLMKMSPTCGLLAPALYDSTSQCGCLTDPGEAAACAAGEVLLTVEKSVVNDHGGNAKVGDFPLFVGITPVTSGEQNSFLPGVYSVSETGDPGYAVTYGGDCAPDGSITLELGPPKTCTVTNDDIPASLTVVKNLVPDTDPGHFTLWIGNTGGVVASLDNAGDGGTLGPVELKAGDYKVGEDGFGGTNLADYATAIGGDCAADGSISLALAENRTCTIENGKAVAYFLVKKDFSDNNPATVTVQMSCQTGMYTKETFDISETANVNFVVTLYPLGALNCRIQELKGDTNGYGVSYVSGTAYGHAGAVREEDDGCYFDEIQFGQFTCDLTNELEPVDLTVNTQWFGIDGHSDIDLHAEANYICYNVRSGPASSTGNRSGRLSFNGETSSASIAGLYPDWDGSSYCSITETEVFSGAEFDDSACAEVPLTPGNDTDCAIINTVFFEGIPTLDHRALLILLLAVLGAGLIGIRRWG